MRLEKTGKLAPGHKKILQELAARGALTKEEIATLIGNRNLAVKYRRDLEQWGLIRLAPRRVANKTIDVYMLTAKGLETWYACQLFTFFEQALLAGESKSMMIDPNGGIIIREDDLHNLKGLKLLAIFYYYQLPAEVARIRIMLAELWDNLILAQFEREEREALVNYRQKLKQIHRLYLEIWLRRILKKTYGVKGKSLHDVLAEVVKIPSTEEQLRGALMKYYIGNLDHLNKLVKESSKVLAEPNERDLNLMETLLDVYINYCIWQVDNMIVDVELLGRFLDDITRDEEVAAEAAEEEKARLQALYNDLTNPVMLRLYQQFLDKRARQTKELIIIPSGGFRGYFKQYWDYVNALGDEEEKKRVMQIFKKASEASLWTPFILYGILPEPPVFGADSG
jgi:hypothetical protein